VYRQAAGSGDVVIQKQYIAIVDRRAPVSAMPFLSLMDRDTDRDRTFLVGHHLGAYRLMSSGLHCIESVSSRCHILRKKHTMLGQFLASTQRSIIFGHQ
jgi:hypothetical protein